MTVDLPNISGSPIHRMISAAMVAAIDASPLFDGAFVEQVDDPKRRLRDMTEGAVLIDCIGIGIRSEPWNRRNFRRTYITHVAVRCKLPDAKVTAADLDELGAVAEAVQTFIEDQKTLTFTGGGVTLLKAEPFVLMARDNLYGEGLYLTPIEFQWAYKPG